MAIRRAVGDAGLTVLAIVLAVPASRAALLALGLLGAALAGCVGSGELAATTDGPGTAPVPSNDGDGSFRMLGCEGTSFHIPLPGAYIAPHLPAAFTASGFVPTTGDLIVELYDCPDGVTPDGNSSAAWVLWSRVKVEPIDGSWGEFVFQSYWFDFFASPGLAAELQRAGIPARPGTLVRQDEPGEVLASHSWVVEDPTARLELTWAHATPSGTPGENHSRHMWLGEGPFQRYDLRYESTFDDPTGQAGAVLALEGDLKTIEILGAPRAPARALALADVRWELDPVPEVFG